MSPSASARPTSKLSPLNVQSVDNTAVGAIAHELDTHWRGARIDKISQPTSHSWVWGLRIPGRSESLYLSIAQELARVHLTRTSHLRPATPPNFCLLLRKHLEGGRLIRVEQPEQERVLRFYCEATNEIGDRVSRIFVIELMGKYSNAFLLDGDGIILACHHTVDETMSREREIFPGIPYVLPPQMGEKTAWDDVTEEKLARWCTENPTRSLPDILVRHIRHIGKPTAQMISQWVDRGHPDTIDDAGRAPHAPTVWAVWLDWLTLWREGAFAPRLLPDHAYTMLPESPRDRVPWTSPSRLLDDYYSEIEAQQFLGKSAHQLQKIAQEHLKKIEQKIIIQQGVEDQSEAAEQWREAGDLLLANLHAIAPHQSEASVLDYYQDPPGERLISLDPHLTPSQNAQRFFKRYNKARNGAIAAQRLLSELDTEKRYWSDVSWAIAQAQTLDDLQIIREELSEQGYLPKPKESGRRKANEAELEKKRLKSSLLTFHSSDGSIIRLGKNNRQNEFLTLRLATPQDIWLHVQLIPGSHVVIETENGRKPASEQAIYEAAQLAAYYSQGRQSSKVPVVYTHCKRVRKPQGSRPGMVIYEGEKTLFVTPNEGELLQPISG